MTWKDTEDILMPASVQHMEEFSEVMANRTELENVTFHRSIMFIGCQITQEAYGGMKIGMTKYMSTIEAINIDMKRKSNQLGKVN